MIDDADWTFFGEIGAKWIQSQGESSDDENEASPKDGPSKHQKASGADLKDVLANSNMNEVGMTIAACKK